MKPGLGTIVGVAAGCAAGAISNAAHGLAYREPPYATEAERQAAIKKKLKQEKEDREKSQQYWQQYNSRGYTGELPWETN